MLNWKLTLLLSKKTLLLPSARKTPLKTDYMKRRLSSACSLGWKESISDIKTCKDHFLIVVVHHLFIKVILKANGILIEENVTWVCLRLKYKINHDYYTLFITWNFTVGHVDKGESEFVTALRETKEEAGFSESDLKIITDFEKTLQVCVF